MKDLKTSIPRPGDLIHFCKYFCEGDNKEPHEDDQSIDFVISVVENPYTHQQEKTYFVMVFDGIDNSLQTFSHTIYTDGLSECIGELK